MELDKMVHYGYLLMSHQGKIVLKKSWLQKYCVLYKGSNLGIERLEIYDNFEDVAKNMTPKIITLNDCIKISPRPPNMFTILTKTTQYEFATYQDEDLNQWITALQSVAFKDDVSNETSIEEDNDLYCSSSEGVFLVKLWASEASIRCKLEPKMYTLVIASSAIQLRESADNRLLFTWPYYYIRRYGCQSGKFTFEAGRKCESGEGTFYLKHSNQQEIFKCLASKLKSMKKSLGGDAALLDGADSGLQAALSMEARSRSPLPPSPGAEAPAPKQVPAKPPRKTLAAQPTPPADGPMYEPLQPSLSYDLVECRQNAWRTLGISDVKHSETPADDDADLVEYMSWTGRPGARGVPPPARPADQGYDRLNFFGPSSKPPAQSGYKQVVAGAGPAAPTGQTFAPAWNDYDEVEVNMQSVRLADDSHLGYAMIRKGPGPASAATPDAHIQHEVFNDSTYAVISKPKRV